MDYASKELSEITLYNGMLNNRLTLKEALNAMQAAGKSKAIEALRAKEENNDWDNWSEGYL